MMTTRAYYYIDIENYIGNSIFRFCRRLFLYNIHLFPWRKKYFLFFPTIPGEVEHSMNAERMHGQNARNLKKICQNLAPLTMQFS